MNDNFDFLNFCRKWNKGCLSYHILLLRSWSFDLTDFCTACSCVEIYSTTLIYFFVRITPYSIVPRLQRHSIYTYIYIYKSGFLREIRVFSRCAWRNFEEITQSSKRTDTWDDREKSAFPERHDGNILQFRQNWILSLTSCSVTVNFWDSCVFCSKRWRRPLMGRVITPTRLSNNFVISPVNMKIQRN